LLKVGNIMEVYKKGGECRHGVRREPYAKRKLKDRKEGGVGQTGVTRGEKTGIEQK